MTEKRIKISVVVPVYKSADSLEILMERLDEVLSGSGKSSQVIFVDDCSPDNSWEVLKRIKQRYGAGVKIARLQINRGQHNALLCGFHLAEGDIVVTMDDDLQNPPEELPKLVAAVERGYDVAIGAYDTKRYRGMQNFGGRMVDKALRLIFKLPPNFKLTSFRAIKRSVVRSVVQMGGAFPYITAMVLSNSSNYVNVPVKHDPRPFGKSNYSMKRSFSLAANLIFNYSPYPIYLIAVLCMMAFVISITFGAVILTLTLIRGPGVPGFATTIVVVSFFNALILLCLTVFGVYLSRMHQQMTRTRRPFTIDELHD